MLYGKLLHPILQLTDPFIHQKAYESDPLAKAYLSRVGGISGMQRRRENIK